MKYLPLKRFCMALMGFLVLLMGMTGCQTGETIVKGGEQMVLRASGHQGSTFSGTVKADGSIRQVSGAVPMEMEFRCYRLECWLDVNDAGPVRFDVYKNGQLLGGVEAKGPNGSCHITATGRSMVGLNSSSKSVK